MARRKRNYKAEYARRIAKAEKAGKTRQAARGHKPKEHLERARRSQSKYGASPATMTRLRNQARAKMLAAYQVIAKARVNERTVARGLKYLHSEDLRAIVNDWSGVDFVNLQKGLLPLNPKVNDSYYDQLDEFFPHSVDLIDEDDTLPGWYK